MAAMVQLTEHFTVEELGIVPADPVLMQNALYLCEQLLEPIRAKFGPVHVHDGYRAPAHNFEVGGKEKSYHLYLAGEAAADIDVKPTAGLSELFDWIRLESGLPFDKVILEFGELAGEGCVHLQIDRSNAPRRLAYVGATGAATEYQQVDVR